MGGSRKHRRRRRQASYTADRPVRQGTGKEGSTLKRIRSLLTDANLAFKWVAGVAAGLVAIAAAVALLRPKPSPAPEASFGSVEVETGQTLDEFSAVAKQVFASFAVPSKGRVVLVAYNPETPSSATPAMTGDPRTGGTTADPTTTDSTSNATSTTSTTAPGATANGTTATGTTATGTTTTGTTTTGTTTAGTTTTGTTTTGTTTTGTRPNAAILSAVHPPFRVNPGVVAVTVRGVGAVGNAPPPSTLESATSGVAGPSDVIVVPPACTTGQVFRCGLTPEIGHELERRVSPLAAAREVDQIFRDARVVHEGRRAYPLGLIVNFDLTLVGFDGQGGTLAWNLTPVGGAQAQAPWWDRFEPAYEVTPHNSPWSRPLSLWIPEPSRLGTYDVSLYYTVRGHSWRTFQRFSVTH